MQAELINPFLGATVQTINDIAKVEIGKGELSLAYSPIKGDEVNITIGITGDLQGQLILCLSEPVAMVLASNMLFGLEVSLFDELSRNAISELGSIITGAALAELGKKGFICHSSPPTLFMGKDMVVSAENLGFLTIPLLSDIGDIKIYITLRETDKEEVRG